MEAGDWLWRPLKGTTQRKRRESLNYLSSHAQHFFSCSPLLCLNSNSPCRSSFRLPGTVSFQRTTRWRFLTSEWPGKASLTPLSRPPLWNGRLDTGWGRLQLFPLQICAWRSVHKLSGLQVPRQVVGTRGHQVQQVQQQVRCLVIWCVQVSAFHLFYFLMHLFQLPVQKCFAFLHLLFAVINSWNISSPANQSLIKVQQNHNGSQHVFYVNWKQVKFKTL